MRYVRIQNGSVVEIGAFDSIEGRFHPSLLWVESDTAEVGELWDGETFTKPAPATAPVPQAVTMRQARLALYGASLLQTVNDAIAAMTGAQGEAARIEWEFSSEVRRNQPLVIALAPALGLTDAQIDQLFITAAAL